MVLLDDVVEVFALTYQDTEVSVSLDSLNGCFVGATLVDSDLLWHIVQVDGTFQKSPGSSHIALGSQQEAHRIASAVNGPLQIFLFTSHIALGFIHPPTLANGVLAPTKYGGRHRHHLDSPSMHCGVVDGNTAFPHHLFNVTQAQRIGHVPSHARQHHFQRVVQPFENFASSAIDQTFTEIMHALDCRLCLQRQNRFGSLAGLQKICQQGRVV